MKDPLSNLKGIMSKFQNAMGMNQTANMAGVLSPGGRVANAEPVSGYSVSSPFGPRVSPTTGASTNHRGVDYAIPQGKLISLKKGGEVTEVMAPNTSSSVSGIVRVTHPDGTESRYVHLSEVMVRKGQQVNTGDAIGKVGGEPGLPGGGGSTGPHLHFEYYPTTSSPPVDGSGVASQYFQVGGTLQAQPQSAQPQARTPNAASSLASPQHQGPVMLPITSGPANPQQSAFNQNIYPSTYLPLYNTENPYLMFTP
jgi:murein DD-endopeptidase MepM/ murein hydrolase activator NlpD